MDATLNDLRYAVRSLRSRIGFTAVAVASVATGVGGITVAFSIIHALHLRPAPFTNPDGLVELYETTCPRPGCPPEPFSVAVLNAWMTQSPRSFEAPSIYRTVSMALANARTPKRVAGAFVDRDFFITLGVAARDGRTFAPTDDAQSVVISHRFWRQELGGASEIVGTRLELDNTEYTIVGVMPREFDHPRNVRIWIPLDRSSGVSDRAFVAVARMTPEATLEDVQAEMSALARRRELSDPAANNGRGATAMPVDWARGGAQVATYQTLAGVIGLIVLVGVTNLAMLFLVAAVGRQSEMAVRSVLGGSPRRIARLLVAESAVIGIVGGIGGLFLAIWGASLVDVWLERSLGTYLSLGIDRYVIAFACLISLGVAVVLGLVPMIPLSTLDLPEQLRGSAAGFTTGTRHRRARDLFIASEVAVAFVLVLGAVLLTRSLVHTRRFDLGFDADRVLSASIDLTGQRFDDPQQALSLAEQIEDRLQSMAGVAAAAVWNTPRIPWNFRGGRLSEPPVTVEGADDPFVSPDHLDYPFTTVDGTPALFRTLGLRLLRGRWFNPEDHRGTTPVVVVNEAAAARFWPNQDAVGKRIKIGPASAPTLWMTVVGVIGNTVRVDQSGVAMALTHPTREWPQIFRPLAQSAPQSLRVGVRESSGNPLALIRVLTDLLGEVAPARQVEDVAVLRDAMWRFQGGFANVEVSARMLAVISLVGMCIALMGVYGVVADGVRRRTREIGIRVALGARPGQVLRSVGKNALITGAGGILAGLAGALALTNVLDVTLYGYHYVRTGMRTGLLYGVDAQDPLLFLGTTLLVAIVVILASYLPARHATRVLPMEALRYE
jgi:predicted permease